jgi:hypothetical protein
MTGSHCGVTIAGGEGMSSAYDAVTDPGPLPEIGADGETKVCAKEGCDNTFVQPKGMIGARRKFCDEHKTSFTGMRPKDLDVPRETIADGAPETGERKPGAGPKSSVKKSSSLARVSTADFWSDVVEGLVPVVSKGGLPAMGRAISWTSPVAGDIIEDVTKGGIVDKIVQPVARNQRKYEDLFDLIGLWAAVGYMQTNPNQAYQAVDFAKKRIKRLLPRISKKIVKERKEEKEAVQAMAEIMPEILEFAREVGLEDDPIEALLRMMFQDAVPTEPEPQREPAVA